MRKRDPFATLGIQPGATPDEAAAAYRRLAKRWHPDRAGGETARRMAEINAAYDLLREGAGLRPPVPVPGDARGARRRRAAPGSWLAPSLREALGDELLVALEDREDVRIVTVASARGSGRALLAVTDRRLLWLLDERVMGRVASLRFSAIAAIEERLSWPRRRAAVLRVRGIDGRRVAFSDLHPETARRIAGAAAAPHGRYG